MASRYYVGSTGDWNTTASWSATLGGASGASVPVSDDDVFILGLDHALATNITGLGAVDLGSLTIAYGDGGSIGDAGSALDVAVSGTSSLSPARSGECRIRMGPGAGACYLKAGTNNYEQIHAANQSGSELVLTGGTFSVCYFEGSVTRVKAACSVGSVFNIGSTIILEAGAGTVGALGNTAGNLICERGTSSTHTFYAGQGRYTGTGAVSAIAVNGGARVNYQASGTITDLTVLGPTAVVDDVGNSTGFTVTNTTLTGTNARAFEKPDSTITYTNDPIVIPLKP